MPATRRRTATVTVIQIEDWHGQCARVERLLSVASDHLGEDVPYTEAAKAGVDTVEAMIEGAVALVRKLALELSRAEAPGQN